MDKQETNIGAIIHWNQHPWITSHPGGPKRWLSFYVFPMIAFGLDTIIQVGGDRVEHGFHIKYEHYKNTEEALANYSDFKIVSLSGQGESALKEYKHPENRVLYLIGYDYGDVPENIGGDKVKIENYTNSTVLWSQNCLSILLYDRYLKHGTN